jgi:recombination protein RecT
MYKYLQGGELMADKNFSLALTEKIDEVTYALPSDFNKDRFVQNALSLINENSNLQNYSSAQLIAGLMKGAYLGLDFYSKEAYLVPYGRQLNYQTSYLGAKKLAKKYSIRKIKDIGSKIVREGDHFEETNEGGNSSYIFKPKPFNNGKIIGAFAYVVYEDGGITLDTMSIEELETTRNKSKMSKVGAWKDFTSEMYRKTVLHRLCKHIELDFENPEQQCAYMAETSVNATETKKEEVPDVFVDCEVMENDTE